MRQLHRSDLTDILPADEVVQGFLVQASTMALRADLCAGELCHPLLCTSGTLLLFALCHEVGTEAIIREGYATQLCEAVVQQD